MSDVILVLGMHRSGTSATAGVLTKLGGGSPKHLMGADPSNQRGYFESDLLTELNDKLLVSAGSKWSDWRQFNQGWYKSPVAADFKRAAKDLFASEFEGSTLPVFKDPRICRIAPFWLDVLRDIGAVPHVVIPVRSPLEVTKSLCVHRGYAPGLSTTHALLLWLRHVVDAEFHTRSIPRSIFNWREFRADWRGVCEKISTEAQISWSRMSDRTAHEVDLFLSEELVHHDKELTGDSEVHEWTRRTYEALMELSRNPLSNSALVTLDDIRATLDQSSRIFGRLLIENELGLEAASEQISALAVAAAEDKAALLAEIESLRDQRARIAAELDVRQQELAEHTAAVTELAERADRAEARATEVARSNEVLSKDLAVMQKTHAEQLEALRFDLVDTQAALARTSATKDGIVARLTPMAFARRRTAKALLQTGLFDVRFYMQRYPGAVPGMTLDDREAGLAAAEHYAEEGFCKGYFPNEFFDTHWYIDKYEDVRRSGINPLLHYYRNGVPDGRDPGPGFQTTNYLDANPDVRESGSHPLVHYLRHGRHEGRPPIG